MDVIAASNGKSTKDRVLCFDPAVLTSSDFDPHAFIAGLRTHAPLRLLRDDLRTHISHLQSEIVTCVQNELHNFTSFSTSISDADQLCDAATPPLTDLRNQILSLQDSLTDQISQLDETLARRRALAARASSLRTLSRVDELLHKCERLVAEHTRTPRLALTERVAAESAQLAFAQSRAPQCAYLKSVSARATAVRTAVRIALDVALRRALLPVSAPAAPETLTRVLLMYVTARVPSDAEMLFRREVVGPFAATTLRMTPMLAAAERRKGGAVTPADALDAAADAVKTFVDERVLPLVKLVAEEDRLRGQIDFLARAVWPQLEASVSSHMAPAFSPGLPDVFHRSVKAGERLFGAVEAAAMTDEQRNALRTATATSHYWRHWNMPVYFQLRFQEISSRFDKRMSDGPVALAAAPLGDDGWGAPEGAALLRWDVYRAATTASLVASLRRCWAEDVFLPALTHRFLRLSLQLLARYATWVRTGLAGEWDVADAIPKGAARVFYDITVLQTRLPPELSSVLRLRATNMSSDVLESIDTAFADMVDKYSSLLTDLSTSIADSIGRSCIDNLQPLRGILATYRMSSKPAPTTHSPFVPKILKPLKVFFLEQKDAMDEDHKQTIAKIIVERTSEEYFNMATDLMQRNKSSEATLRRLNISRSGTHTGRASDSSVLDKISTQLYLDVEKFTDEIVTLGMSIDGLESLAKLRDSVKREEKQKDSDEQGQETVVEKKGEGLNELTTGMSDVKVERHEDEKVTTSSNQSD